MHADGALSRKDMVVNLGPLTLRHPCLPSFNYNINADSLASTDKLGTKSTGPSSLQSVSTIRKKAQ